MGDSIIFNSPFMLGGFIVAALLCLFDIIKKPDSYIVTLLSVLIAVGMTIYSLINGASIQDVLIVLLVFAALNLTAFRKREDK